MSEYKIKKNLAEARRLLIEAGNEAQNDGITSLNFMGLVFEKWFGWFTPDGALQEASEWNSSACVIGSNAAEGKAVEDWSSSTSCEWETSSC